MSLAAAFAELAIGVSVAMGGPYHAAVLSWPGTPLVDDGGSIVDPGVPINIDCHAQVDSATETMRGDGGYAAGDVRLLVLAPGLSVPLDTDASVTIATGPHAGRWSIEAVSRDPVAIGHECRGRRWA